jgi:hypothetical protein
MLRDWCQAANVRLRVSRITLAAAGMRDQVRL